MRRQVLWFLGVTLAGVLALSLAGSYRMDVSRWIIADASQFQSRARITFAVLASGLCLSVFALAVYLWWAGDRVVGRRGRVMQVIAIVLAAAVLGLAAMLWRLALLTT
jgi:hypothetical protein